MITLHLGQPKIGTSVLQRALALKAEADDQFVYPTEFRHPGPGHHALAKSLQEAGSFAKIEHKLRALLEDCSGRDVVFSSEQFSNTIGPRHRPVFDAMTQVCSEYDTLQGVLYLRRYDDFFNSMMLQTMRYGGYRCSPEEYVFQRLNGIRTLFIALRNLRSHPQMVFHIKAYETGFDILKSFQDICPKVRGLDKVGPLPRTEKFSWKQQVFIANSSVILGSELTRGEMENMILSMRSQDIQIQDDLTDYCAIPKELDKAIRDASIAAAREQSITEYIDAFEEDEISDTVSKKNYVPFDPTVLTKLDISIMAEFAGLSVAM